MGRQKILKLMAADIFSIQSAFDYFIYIYIYICSSDFLVSKLYPNFVTFIKMCEPTARCCCSALPLRNKDTVGSCWHVFKYRQRTFSLSASGPWADRERTMSWPWVDRERTVSGPWAYRSGTHDESAVLYLAQFLVTYLWLPARSARSGSLQWTHSACRLQMVWGASSPGSEHSHITSGTDRQEINFENIIVVFWLKVLYSLIAWRRRQHILLKLWPWWPLTFPYSVVPCRRNASPVFPQVLLP
jgi:hypothetical protein